MTARLLTVAFCVLRFALLCRFLAHNRAITWIVGASEALAIFNTFRGLRTARVDTSLLGLLVPLGYAVQLLFSAKGAISGSYGALVVLWVAGALQVALRFYMRECVTVGVPMLSRVLTSGPYSLVRHPMAATEIIMALAFALAFVSYSNAVIALLSIAGAIVAATVEERYLYRFPMYCAYAERVAFRFLPYVL